MDCQSSWLRCRSASYLHRKCRSMLPPLPCSQPAFVIIGISPSLIGTLGGETWTS
jgi:hypothetical protein